MATPYDFNFPVVMTAAGPQPTAPATIQAQLLAAIQQNSPDYTATLPGLLIEDILSTQSSGLGAYDQGRVDAINSISPNGANLYVLSMLAAAYGIAPMGALTNTSVPVVFSGSPQGYVVPNGFLVSDGTHVFQVQTGGPIGSSGNTGALTAVATQSGSFGVPVGSVTKLLSAVPSGVTLTVTNAAIGTPGGAAETPQAFRTRVLQGCQAAPVGSPTRIKKNLGNVPGILKQQVAVQVSGGNFRVICGGGDAYAMAYQALLGAGNPGLLVGSAVSSSRNVTVSIFDPPDKYSVTIVNPVAQTVTLSISWNTVLGSFTGGNAFPGLVQPVLAAYLNQLQTGAVINVAELQYLFAQTVKGLLDPALLTTFTCEVFINGTLTAPASGTNAVSGDPEGYFVCQPSGITVTQG